MNFIRQTEKYFKQHPAYHSIVHMIGGIGIGVLLTYPLAGSHPLRWGAAFLALAILGHLYPNFKK